MQGFLTALLLRPRLRQRHHLAGLLFPDLDETLSRRRLSDQLYLLRQTYPSLGLEVTREAIWLPREARWLDVDAFHEAVSRTTLDGCLEALTLYRDDLLAGYCDDWLLEEREALRLRFLGVAHRACDRLLAQHRYGEALPIAERLLLAEPLDEQSVRYVMRAYSALGRRGAALAAFDRFVAEAASVLKVGPEDTTVALAGQIRANSGVPRPSASGLTPGAGPGASLVAAREALAHGDRSGVEIALRRLRESPVYAHIGTQVTLLEVDVGLTWDDRARAERALALLPRKSLEGLLRQAELELARSKWTEAREAASRALLMAHESDDKRAEALALLSLSRVQRQTGETTRALWSGEQAVALARRHGSAWDLANALLVLSQLLLRQAKHAPASAYVQEALELARQHDLAFCRPQGRMLEGWGHFLDGEIVASLACYEKALAGWRDLGLPRREAEVLRSMAELHDYLGQSKRSRLLLEEAQSLLEELGDPLLLAINRYNLVFTLLYTDDALAGEAAGHARAALDVFRALGREDWAASTLVAQGFVHWVAGEYEAALRALDTAQHSLESLAEGERLVEIRAFQGLARLGLGEVARAVALTEDALLRATQIGAAAEDLFTVYVALGRALAAAGEDARADIYYHRGYDVLLGLAGQLHDEEARRNVFRRDPLTRLLMVEVRARGIVERPGRGVVARVLPARFHATHPVQIAWTVDAGPADEALRHSQGAIALRRARLRRLCDEARHQGAAPTTTELAEALGVSVRTVQRDLAFLNDGHV